MKTAAAFVFFTLSALSLLAESRTWTARDGRTIDAEYVSSTKDSVTVRKSNGTTLPIPLALLSDNDVTWVSNQPKPVKITREQVDKIIAEFPSAPALRNGEVTNDLKQLHDKYHSMVKFIRPNTVAANLKIIRNKMDADIKVLSAQGETTRGDYTGKRGSGQSQGAENLILSSRRSVTWLQGTLETYLKSFDALLVVPK